MTHQLSPHPENDRLAALGSASRPEDVVARLRESVGGDLALNFASARTHGYVDGAGRSVEAGGGHAIEIRREGRPIATLRRADNVDGDGLRLDPVDVLLIANAALIAQRRAEIEAWYDAQAELVAVQDLERAQLERDLHDGAQQLVLSLLIELRLVMEDSPPDSAEHSVAAAASAEVAEALNELRVIAHGIYPVELDRGGLMTATGLLADHLHLRIDVDGATDLPDPIQMAVYRLVEAAAEQAAWRGAAGLKVTLTGDAGLVRAEILATDGQPLSCASAADRVVALRGECWDGIPMVAVLPLTVSGMPPTPPPELPTELDGSYQQVITESLLRAAGFTDTHVPNGRPGVSETGAPLDMLIENSGTFRHELHRGTYRWTQDQPAAKIVTAGAGYYVVEQDQLVLTDGRLAMDGRPLVLRFRWSRHPDGSLTLSPLDEWNASRVIASAPWFPVAG